MNSSKTRSLDCIQQHPDLKQPNSKGKQLNSLDTGKDRETKGWSMGWGRPPRKHKNGRGQSTRIAGVRPHTYT